MSLVYRQEKGDKKKQEASEDKGVERNGSTTFKAVYKETRLTKEGTNGECEDARDSSRG